MTVGQLLAQDDGRPGRNDPSRLESHEISLPPHHSAAYYPSPLRDSCRWDPGPWACCQRRSAGVGGFGCPDVYGRFSKRFDTPDLQDAKALLYSL